MGNDKQFEFEVQWSESDRAKRIRAQMYAEYIEYRKNGMYDKEAFKYFIYKAPKLLWKTQSGITEEKKMYEHDKADKMAERILAANTALREFLASVPRINDEPEAIRAKKDEGWQKWFNTVVKIRGTIESIFGDNACNGGSADYYLTYIEMYNNNKNTVYSAFKTYYRAYSAFIDAANEFLDLLLGNNGGGQNRITDFDTLISQEKLQKLDEINKKIEKENVALAQRYDQDILPMIAAINGKGNDSAGEAYKIAAKLKRVRPTVPTYNNNGVYIAEFGQLPVKTAVTSFSHDGLAIVTLSSVVGAYEEITKPWQFTLREFQNKKLVSLQAKRVLVVDDGYTYEHRKFGTVSKIAADKTTMLFTESAADKLQSFTKK